MTQIYLSSSGQRTGPHSLQTLQSWLDSKQLDSSSPAWFEGCTNWVTVADVPGVKINQPVNIIESSPPPQPQIHISRNGQSFGPYTVNQATEFLNSGQLLASDYAMVDGQSNWDTLSKVLNDIHPRSKANNSSLQGASVKARAPASSKRPKKTVKLSGLNKKNTQIKVKEKSLFSKILATFVVFIITSLVVGGSTLGAYLIAPMEVGPVARKFGIPIEHWFPGRELESIEITEAPPGRLQDIRIGKEQWHHINSSGIKLLPIEGDVGLQVISSIDQKLAMNDEDIRVLLLIAQHLVVLDLTQSEVTDQGLETLKKFPNLQSLTLEGSSKITSAGIRHLVDVTSLEKLNLVRVKLDDSAVDFLSKMGGLREVYLYDSQISDEAIQRLKDERPQVFVNSG